MLKLGLTEQLQNMIYTLEDLKRLFGIIIFNSKLDTAVHVNFGWSNN